MKRFKKQFAALCLIAATILSGMVGVGMPRIQGLSADIISRLFPVVYQVTYRSGGAQSLAAPVRFTTDTAIISAASGDTVIPVSDAVFVCLQDELRLQNAIRSGLLAALIILTVSFLLTALAAMAFTHGPRKARSGLKRHTHVAPHRANSNTRHAPTVPSAA